MTTPSADLAGRAQNKSLLLFAAEAYNVEMGVTNDLFPNERTTGIDCTTNTTPEDVMPNPATLPSATQTTFPGVNEISAELSTDIQDFLMFMRLNAAPAQCAFNSGVNPSTGQSACLSLSSTAGVNANVVRDDVEQYRTEVVATKIKYLERKK